MKIDIDYSDLTDLVWMSYRYCIGRHTIAAAMHPETIWKLIDNYYDNKNQALFTAKDIRRCVEDQRSFGNNEDLSVWENLADRIEKKFKE